MGLGHLHLAQQQQAAARRRRCGLGNIWGRAGSHTSVAPTRVPPAAPMPPGCYIASQKVTRPVNVVHGSAIKGQCCPHVSDPACPTGSVVDGRRANTPTPTHHAATLRPAAQCTPQSIRRVHTLPGLVLEGFGPHPHRLVNVQHNARWVSLLIRRQAAWVQPSHHLRQRIGGGGEQMPHALQLQRWEGDEGRVGGLRGGEAGCLDASRTVAAAQGAASGAFCLQAVGAMRSGSRGEPHSTSAPRAASCTASHASDLSAAPPAMTSMQ